MLSMLSKGFSTKTQQQSMLTPAIHVSNISPSYKKKVYIHSVNSSNYILISILSTRWLLRLPQHTDDSFLYNWRKIAGFLPLRWESANDIPDPRLYRACLGSRNQCAGPIGNGRHSRYTQIYWDVRGEPIWQSYSLRLTKIRHKRCSSV